MKVWRWTRLLSWWQLNNYENIQIDTGSIVAWTDLDEGDEVLHVLDDLCDGEIFKDVLTYTDDLPNLGLVEGQEKGRGAL